MANPPDKPVTKPVAKPVSKTSDKLADCVVRLTSDNNSTHSTVQSDEKDRNNGTERKQSRKKLKLPSDDEFSTSEEENGIQTVSTVL